MAQRIFISDLTNKRYDHVLIAMGAIEHDARLLNMAHTLGQRYARILLVGLFTPNWQKSCNDLTADVLLMENYTFTPMYKLWAGYYRWLNSFRKNMIADAFWAMDLYTLPYASWISRRQKAMSLYDSREVYSALGTTSDHPVKQKIISFIESKYITQADKIFTSGPLDSKHLAQIYRIPVPEVVMNLPRFQKPATSNLLRDTFQISGSKKILLYQGGIHPGRGLMQSVDILADIPELVLCILGSGEVLKNQLLKVADRTGVADRVFFHDPVPYNDLLKWTASADIGLCFIEPLSLSLRYALPNKLFEYAMAGIPSIVSDLPQMTPYVEKYNCGILLPPDADKSTLTEAIRTLFDEEKYYRMRQNALRLAADMNWEKQQDVIFRLAENGRK